jgi:hypothetical protein
MAIAAFLLEVLRADYKGPPRPQAQPSLPRRGIGEAGALAPTELQEEYKRLNEQAAKTARELRELKTADGWRNPGVAHQLRSVLRSTVAGLFEIRQQIQRRELAEYQARLARIEQQIEEREPLKAIIIDRRVEELINPAVAWPPDVSQAMDARSGTAAQAKFSVPKAAGAPAPGDEGADSQSRLRERFVKQFPEMVSPEVAGEHRDTSLDEFVDISPEGDLAATVRPAVGGRSYVLAIWDAKTGASKARTPRAGTAATVRFSAKGDYLGVHKFLANEFDVFEVPTGRFVGTIDYEPSTSWEAAFNRFAEDQAGKERDPGGVSTPTADATIRSVDNQRELGIISAGSDDGMRPGMTLGVYDGETYLGRVTVVKTNKDTSLVRIEEENAAMPIRRGDRVTAAPPNEAIKTVQALAWRLLGAKLEEHGPAGRFPGGMQIQELRPEGPAAQAKLLAGDVLVGLDNWEIRSYRNLGFALEHVRPQSEQTRDVKALMVRDGETVSAILTLTAPADGDGAATSLAESEEFAVRGSVHVLIQSPRGATMFWTPRSADGRSLFRAPPGFSSGGARKTLPASFVVAHGQRVPFHLRDMPGRGDLRMFGSLEIAPLSEVIFPFVASSAIPIEITEENLNRAWSGEQVVKVIFLPYGEHGDDAKFEVRTLDAPGLKAGDDPVDEARRRGVELRRDHVLAILRLSRQYESIGANEEHGPRMELSPRQPPAAAPRESKPVSPEPPAPESAKNVLKSAIENTKWHQEFSMKVNSKQQGERQLVSDALIRRSGSKLDFHWTTQPAGEPENSSAAQSHRSIDNGVAWISRTTPAGDRHRSGGLSVADRRQHAARAFASWTFGFALDGYVPGNGSKNLLEILSEASDLVAKEDTVDRVRCLYIGGSTEYGDVAVWLDPASNYALRQAIVFKERGNRYDESRLGEHPDTVGLESVGFVVSKTAYTEIGGYSIPTSGVVEFTQTRDGQAPERWSITYTRSEIDLAPDLTGSDAFQVDFENGARISDWDAKGRDAYFHFRDGKLIPQQEPGRAIDLEDVHLYRAPPPPPDDASSWPLFRGGPQMTGVAAASLPDDHRRWSGVSSAARSRPA